MAHNHHNPLCRLRDKPIAMSVWRLRSAGIQRACIASTAPRIDPDEPIGEDTQTSAATIRAEGAALPLPLAHGLRARKESALKGQRSYGNLQNLRSRAAPATVPRSGSSLYHCHMNITLVSPFHGGSPILITRDVQNAVKACPERSEGTAGASPESRMHESRILGSPNHEPSRWLFPGKKVTSPCHQTPGCTTATNRRDDCFREKRNDITIQSRSVPHCGRQAGHALLRRHQDQRTGRARARPVRYRPDPHRGP